MGAESVGAETVSIAAPGEVVATYPKYDLDRHRLQPMYINGEYCPFIGCETCGKKFASYHTRPRFWDLGTPLIPMCNTRHQRVEGTANRYRCLQCGEERRCG